MNAKDIGPEYPPWVRVPMEAELLLDELAVGSFSDVDWVDDVDEEVVAEEVEDAEVAGEIEDAEVVEDEEELIVSGVAGGVNFWNLGRISPFKRHDAFLNTAKSHIIRIPLALANSAGKCLTKTSNSLDTLSKRVVYDLWDSYAHSPVPSIISIPCRIN